MNQAHSTSKLFLLFNEIAKGYSKRDFRGKPVYIKHLGINEKSFFDYRYQEFFNFAIKAGISTEEESLKRVMSEGFWSKEEEESIKKQKDFIDRLFVTKRNLFKSAEIAAINKQIDDERNILKDKINQRREIIGKTAEEYASNRSNDYVVFESLYTDEEMKNKLFKLEEFEDMTYGDLVEYILFYNEYMHEFEEVNVQKIALMDFFQPYFLVLDHPTEFFGKPMINLTDVQVRLIIYGKIFKNIFETNEHIPDHIKQDPEALFQYVDKEKAREKFNSGSKGGENASAEMVFGASKQDLPPEAQEGISLNKLMKDKKMLTMDELMKLHGEG